MHGSTEETISHLFNTLHISVHCSSRIRFVADGGWQLLNGWLVDAKASDNTPVIMELIKVFKQLPVTIDILKKNNTAKLIKQMTKGEGDESKYCKDSGEGRTKLETL